jgi:hypothetical protein
MVRPDNMITGQGYDTPPEVTNEHKNNGGIMNTGKLQHSQVTFIQRLM